MSKRTQTMFTESGDVSETVAGLTAAQQRRYVKMIAELKERERQRATCPWCMYRGTLREFSKVNTKFDVLKNVECPECGQGMKERTSRLVDDLGPEDYSEWLWDQVFSWRAYEKVSWEKLKAGVRAMGFSNVFWDTWRRKKGLRDTPAPTGSRRGFEASKMDYYKEREKEKEKIEEAREARKKGYFRRTDVEDVEDADEG